MGGLLLDPAVTAPAGGGIRIVVTGANGGVGRNLLAHAAASSDVEAVAVVRSERAASSLRGIPGVDVRVVSGDDPEGLARAVTGASSVVHLAGILIESRAATYEQANVAATEATIAACRRAGVAHLVLVSAIGADANSSNRYRRSKGEGERAVQGSQLNATIIRTPILLGPDSAGAAAVVRAASSGTTKLLGGGHYVMRPLDLDDLSRAVLGACRRPAPGVHVHELAGPEPIAYRDLIARAATMMGRDVSIGAVPIWVAKLGAAIKSRLTGGGVSPAVIDVITANEQVAHNADADLGITLTPLSDTIAKILPTGRPTNMNDAVSAAPADAPAARKPSALQRVLFLAITALCFVFLYFRLSGAATREGLSLVDYMSRVFSNVAWVPWLGLMLAYSCFYFLIDTRVTTSALNWFLEKQIRYADILPIRASAYIISIFSEQIGKGAMAYYLNRRHGVPGWEVGSVMLFIMFCEVFYLLAWATIGFGFTRSGLPEAFGLIPWLALGGAVVLALWVLYFSGTIFPGSEFRNKKILHAFRVARPWHYGAFFLLRSPALLGAGVVYTIALRFFGVPASFLTLFPYLPVIFFAATVPTPMRAAAITSWVILFPENVGQMAAFGFVQHNFFVLFNALLGLFFWPRARRELLDR